MTKPIVEPTAAAAAADAGAAISSAAATAAVNAAATAAGKSAAQSPAKARAARKLSPVVWTFMYALALAFEFFTRALDLVGVEVVPVIGGTVAVCVVLWGFFKLQRSDQEGNALRRANAIKIILLGLIMVVCFMMFKMWMPTFLG